MPDLKNSTPSGRRQKTYNRYLALRLYLIFGSVLLMLIFGIYTQILIQNAKRDAQFVPRLFAQYIAYTDSYLKEAEKNTELLTQVLIEYLQSAGDPNYQDRMWNYLNTRFITNLRIPIVITDPFYKPTSWYHLGIPEGVPFDNLSEADQKLIMRKLHSMISVPIFYAGDVLGYAYFHKPISFQEFIKRIDYSIVVTDRYKIPLYWRNINLPENKSYSDLTTAEQQHLNQRTRAMYEIPITNESDSLGYAYFATSTSLSRIRYLVYLELLLMVAIIMFGTYGLMLLKRTEKDSLWVGLAKETAHQFGTPITSLMGWVDYLKAHPGGFKTEKEYEQFIEWMTADLEKLKTVASRFGKVGSTIKLLPEDLHSILYDITDYFRDRLPHQSSRIDIHLISKIEGVRVLMDTDLIRWTLENMIKNCIDAMGKKGGNIIITASQKDQWVYIHIMDEGKGIPRSMWKKIFDPGVTSKTRGWGLGLSLAKRIIEEYHQGRIRVLESAVNEGTTFEIMLHVQQEGRVE